MVRRNARSSFGSAYAFPGGVVDPGDKDIHDNCDGVDAVEADRRLALESGGLDYYVAAIRELFEETGVLLATTESSVRQLRESRERMNAGKLSWNDFARASGTRMLCRELFYFAHWITPVVMSKRYSTRFFAAALPGGQVATHDENELTDSRWMRAADALAAGKQGRMKMHYPTQKTLEQLLPHKRVADLLTWAQAAEADGVETILPVLPEPNRG
jgi:8-oxo-dGTP pyrophosphatase MutT (NUDIX family)